MIFRNKHLLALGGKLFKFPSVLINYIADIFEHGWDRNRAIDSIGNHGNALMGSYLLASSNLTISITGLLTTDTLVALTENGLVGNINTNGLISFTEGLNYGAFEIYRDTTLIGRFSLTERQGSRLINQVTGTLGNGLLGGTLTTVWQRSNAFYSETNENGYSISGTGWITNNGDAIDVGTLIPADLSNPTKCMAWVAGVQQDLQFVGKAQNSVSLVPTAFYCDGDRYWVGNTWGGTVSKYELTIHCRPLQPSEAYGTLYASTTFGVATDRGVMITSANSVRFYYPNGGGGLVVQNVFGWDVSIIVSVVYDLSILKISVQNALTGVVVSNSKALGSTLTFASSATNIGRRNTGTYRYKGWLGMISESIDGVLLSNYIPCQHTINIYDIAQKVTRTLNGISTNLLQNVDLVYNAFNQTGYELWTNGTDYLIYPLASDGTRYITPVDYTLVETVTAGNMPSVADSRFTTFKYALANSYEVRKIVPEAYNTDAQSTPKLLTYNELKDLENNQKVRITEVDNKITNLKILE